MRRGVVIDSCTMGDLANPNETLAAIECREWAENLRRRETLVRIPGIVIYECRRKLLHINSMNGVAKLDDTVRIFGFLELSYEVLEIASHLWARLRRLGRAATNDLRLDADVIIAAEATWFSIQESVAVTVATDNIQHFGPLIDGTHIVAATDWRNIGP